MTDRSIESIAIITKPDKIISNRRNNSTEDIDMTEMTAVADITRNINLTALQALLTLLDNLEGFLKEQVEANRHWDIRIPQVDRMVKKLFQDPEVLKVAGPRIEKLVATLRQIPIAPPGVLEQLDQVHAASLDDLKRFKAAIGLFTPQDYAMRIDLWLRNVESRYFVLRASIPKIVDKLRKEVERKAKKLKTLAKCPEIDDTEEDELD